MKISNLTLGRYDFAAYASFTAYALCSLAIPIVIVSMAKDLDFPLAEGGMAQGGALHLVRSIAMIVTLLLCGPIAGRFGNRMTLGTGMLFMGIGVLFCALSPVYWLLLPLLAIAGLGEGICEGVATPFVQNLHPDQPERYVNIAHSFWSVGILVCVLLAGGLITLGFDWRIVLGGCGVLALLASLLVCWKEAKGKEYPERKEKVNLKEVWQQTVKIHKTPRYWVYCAGMFMGAGSEFCLTFWAAAYLELNFAATTFVAGLGTGAIAAGMFLGRTVFGYFASKNALPKILLACGLGTIPLSLALVFLKPDLFPNAALMYATVFVLLFLCGIGIAPYWPTLQVHGVNNMPELDSTLLYIYFSAWGIPGCGFFTWIFGVVGDYYKSPCAAVVLIPVSLIVFSLIVFCEHWVFKNKRKLAE